MRFRRQKPVPPNGDTASSAPLPPPSAPSAPNPTSAPNPAPAPTDGAAIAEFWRWWVANAGRFAEVIDQRGDLGPLAEDLSTQLARVSSDPLEWELMPGRSSTHALCISAGAIPDLRSVVTRIHAAAPPATSTWEYLSARPADPNAVSLVLGFGADNIAFSDLRFGVTEFQSALDLVVYHPTFADLTETAQSQATFLALNSLLGEEATGRWIGAIIPSAEPVIDPVLPGDLPGIVETFANEHPDPEWVLLQGTQGNGDPILIRAMRPLRSATYPSLDLHCEIIHHYAENNDGLPAGDDRQRLIELEDAIEVYHAAGASVVTVVTGSCRQTLHLYCDAQSAAPAAIGQILASPAYAPYVSATWTPDPGWNQVAEYR